MLLQVLRRNAHAMNYVVFGAAILAPAVIYAEMRTPTTDEVEETLNEGYSGDLARARDNTARINAFWKHRMNAKEMDEVYAGLLRAGSSAQARHHHLTGKLAEEAAKQDPKFAHKQALLTLPPSAAQAASTPATATGSSSSTAPPAAPPAAA